MPSISKRTHRDRARSTGLRIREVHICSSSETDLLQPLIGTFLVLNL